MHDSIQKFVFAVIVVSGMEASSVFAAVGLTPLGDLPGGSFLSTAQGVSSDGSVVVGRGQTSGLSAFRWTAADGMTNLGDLPGGGSQAYALGVSGDGLVAVGSGDSASGYEAFRWTAGGGMVGLGDLPGGEFHSHARDASSDGSIVVGVGSTDLGNEAFYWHESGMVRLWDVLLSNNINPSADGWSKLIAATDVSSDGLTIVGYGERNGYTEGFVAVIAVVPEPASVSLSALIGAAMSRRRRSR